MLCMEQDAGKMIKEEYDGEWWTVKRAGMMQRGWSWCLPLSFVASLRIEMNCSDASGDTNTWMCLKRVVKAACSIAQLASNYMLRIQITRSTFVAILVRSKRRRRKSLQWLVNTSAAILIHVNLTPISIEYMLHYVWDGSLAKLLLSEPSANVRTCSWALQQPLSIPCYENLIMGSW